MSLRTAGRPVGCLRLYEKNTTDKRFDAIDSGGILVDTCEISSRSGALDLSGVLGVEEGKAILDGDKYVSCDLNLVHWLTEVLSPTSEFSGHEALFNTFVETAVPTGAHGYRSFTIVSEAVITVTTEGLGLAPLVNYQPQPDPDSPGAVDFSVQLFPSNSFPYVGVTFPLPGKCPSDGSCPGYDAGEDVTWWYDYLANEREFPLQYVAEGMSASDKPNQSAPTLGIPPEALLQFWIGAAKLYVGYNPVTDVGLHGTIDSILIDPSNSKPTGQ